MSDLFSMESGQMMLLGAATASIAGVIRIVNLARQDRPQEHRAALLQPVPKFTSYPALRPAGTRRHVARRASLANVAMRLSPAIVGGNFKCNGTKESITELLSSWDNLPDNVDVVVFPPFVYLDHTKQVANGKVQVGAQNSWSETGGAYTGEVAPSMLKDAGFDWVIIGHSERRSINGESDALLGQKLRAALDAGLKVIYCVGELLEEREAGTTNAVVTEQMGAITANISNDEWKDIVIAYEPVWAIGTGKVATPEQAQDVHKVIREWVNSNVSPAVAEELRIQYGGSVKAANAKELSSQPDIDGFLVGGASLLPEFAEIVRFCS